jgi:Spy/CpxP family protein refolding chaperone
MMMVAVIALAAIVVSPAMAFREVMEEHGRGPGGVADIAVAKGLDLTAGQTEKINTLREAHLKEIKPLRDQLSKMRAELRSAWLQTTPDRDRIMAFQQDATNLRNRMEEEDDRAPPGSLPGSDPGTAGEGPGRWRGPGHSQAGRLSPVIRILFKEHCQGRRGGVNRPWRIIKASRIPASSFGREVDWVQCFTSGKPQVFLHTMGRIK